MKILIINQPSFNRGDESAHKGLLRALISRIPDIKIKVLFNLNCIESFRQYAIKDPRVQYVPEPSGFFSEKLIWQGMHKNRTFLWRLHPVFWKMKEIYTWADIIVCAPGGICMGGFQDWDHLFHLELARFYHKPLAYYGRSFGPFPTETKDNVIFKAKSLELLHYFSFLSIRDHKSEELAKELQLSFVSTVDTAFLDSPQTEIPYELQSLTGEFSYMVLVPNYLRWHYAYKTVSHDEVLSFYCRLIDYVWDANPELSIVMLPQLFCGNDYSLSDIDFFREIAKRKNDSRIIVTADCYSSDIQQIIIKNAKYVIGARYHSIVFAINQNTPFISLGYEHKMKGLLETIDQMDSYIEFSNTFESEENQSITLTKIRNIIPQLGSISNAHSTAKSIADACMNQFVNQIIKNHE